MLVLIETNILLSLHHIVIRIWFLKQTPTCARFTLKLLTHLNETKTTVY